MSELPDQLTVERHRDLAGRGRHPWVRRVAITLCSGMIVAALLGAIGQSDRAASARGPTAQLTVTAPEVLRGGLLWRARIDVRALEAIELPRLVLRACS